MRIQGAFVADAARASQWVSVSAHHLAKPAVRLAWLDALAGFAVLLRCVHYPYLDIRVNREVKIKVRIWVSLPMIDVLLVEMAKECHLAHSCAVFDS